MSKKQKKDKAACSTRQLMGIEEIKDYCIATRMGNLVFFIIKPTRLGFRSRRRCGNVGNWLSYGAVGNAVYRTWESCPLLFHVL